MATHPEDCRASSLPLKRTAVWLLPLLLGGVSLAVFAVLGDVASTSTQSSAQEESSAHIFGPVDGLTPVVGDWANDGRDKVGFYRARGNNGRFVVDYNGNGSVDGDDRTALYGSSNLTPIIGDWNGDGRDQVGIFRTSGSNAQFVLDSNDNGSLDSDDLVITYGAATDKPIVGDWNGDGRDEIGNFRAYGTSGQFIMDSNGNGSWDPQDRVAVYGFADDRPIVGDWNGDGRDEIGVHRVYGTKGQFILDFNDSGSWEADDLARIYGAAEDSPIVGDWNGDGRDDIGIYRSNNSGPFVLDSNGNGSWEAEDLVVIYRVVHDAPLMVAQRAR